MCVCVSCGERKEINKCSKCLQLVNLLKEYTEVFTTIPATFKLEIFFKLNKIRENKIDF